MSTTEFALYPYSEETTQLYMKTTDDVVTDKGKSWELKTDHKSKSGNIF